MTGEEVRKLIKERGETQKAIADLLGIAANKLSKSLKGERRFTVREVDILRRYFGVPAPDAPIPQRKIPVVGLVSAGYWRDGFRDVIDHVPLPDPRLSKDAFAVRPEGTSMNQVATDRDYVVVEPHDKRLVDKGYYIVRNGHGEMTFKQYRENPARLEPCSDDPSHCTIFIGEEGFEVVGRARKVVRDL